MAFPGDTICAPASGSGGAISVIRISGPDALGIVDSVVEFRRGKASESGGYRIKFGVIRDIDEVLVSIFRSPASYTGEDAAEICCHASPYIVTSILDRLVAAGCRLAGPGEFTQRAFVAGKMDLAQAEAVADLISSSSEAEHRVAMNQMKGAYSAELRTVRDKLLELSALLELELDFSEEEVEFADRSKLKRLCSAASDRCLELAASFKAGNALRSGIPVAIVGAPNSGKSTLLNALLGDDRAIVSDVPGTTRDTVEELFVIDGVKFRLIDTAGLRESSDMVEKMGIERSREAISKSSIILYVHDASEEGSMVAGSLMSDLAVTGSMAVRLPVAEDQVLVDVWNKIDMLKDRSVSDGPLTCSQKVPHPHISATALASNPSVAISALTGKGLPSLRKALTYIASRRFVDTNQSILVTNARHAAALRAASESLNAVLSGLTDGLSGDLVAEDLRAAIASINSILGEDLITPQDTLNEIFGRFCIGK